MGVRKMMGVRTLSRLRAQMLERQERCQIVVCILCYFIIPERSHSLSLAGGSAPLTRGQDFVPVGVEKCLQLLHDEFRPTMQLMGRRSVAENQASDVSFKHIGGNMWSDGWRFTLESCVLSALLRFVRMFLQGRPCSRSVLLTFSWSLVEADSILGGRRGDQLPPRMEDACWLFCTNASKADLVQGRLMHILATCTMLFTIDRHYCFISFVIHVFNFLTSSMLVYLLALGPVVD